MKYPDNERILIVRPCLKAICLGVRSASKLLSVLLYRARNCKEDETTFTFTCTQFDLVHDLCEELTTKQLHDMAIPVLQLLGYLDVNGSGFRHTYTVHLDKVQEALACYKNKEVLELLLISFIYQQLEEVPMELELVPIQLEEVLKHLELLLKTIGKSSNCKRGRKPRPQVALEVSSENVDSNRDITDSITDNRDSGAFAPSDFLPPEDEISEEDEAPTVRMPAIKLNGHIQQPPSEQTPGVSLQDDQAQPSLLLGPEPAQAGSNPPAATEPVQAAGKPDGKVAQERTQEKPKRGRKNEVQLTLHEQEIKEWYEELRGVEISLSKRTLTALAALGKRKMSKDDFLSVTAILDSDKWFEEHRVGVDLYWINFHWENKIIFLQRKKPPLADTKPMDVYTANSMDKEKMRLRLEQRKADRLAREAAAQQRGVN